MQKWVIFLFLHTNDLCFKIKAICVLDTARLLPHCAGFIFIAHAHRAQQTEAHRSKREKLWVFFHFSSLSRFCPAVLCLCKVYGYALCAVIHLALSKAKIALFLNRRWLDQIPTCSGESLKLLHHIRDYGKKIVGFCSWAGRLSTGYQAAEYLVFNNSTNREINSWSQLYDAIACWLV